MQDLSIGYGMIVAYHSKLKIYHSVISDFHSCDELKFKCLIGVQSTSRNARYIDIGLDFAGLAKGS